MFLSSRWILKRDYHVWDLGKVVQTRAFLPSIVANMTGTARGSHFNVPVRPVAARAGHGVAELARSQSSSGA